MTIAPPSSLARLEIEMGKLRTLVAKLCAELGV